jgi:hypothetical protein
LIDPEGQPIGGIPVQPWYFQKPHFNNLNSSDITEFQEKTDAVGIAVFDWIPVWNQESILFWPYGGDRWARTFITWNPAHDSADKTVQLQRTVPVCGQVRHTDARPAAHILVCAIRDDIGLRYLDKTDDQGRFEMRVAPDHEYLIFVSHQHGEAAPPADIAVRRDARITGIDFQFSPCTTRLHGQLTLGPKKKPWPGQTVVLDQRSSDQKSTFRGVTREATTDAQGQYVFMVGPGKYTISAGDSNDKQELTVSDQKAIECNLHAARELRANTVDVLDKSKSRSESDN